MSLLKMLKKLFTRNKTDQTQNNNNNNVQNNQDLNTPNNYQNNSQNNQTNNNQNFTSDQNLNTQSNYQDNNQIPNTNTQMQQEQNLKLQHQDTVKQVNVQELKQNINTIWDILKIKESTQAEHIIKSLPSDKWITMEELKHNIKLEFNIEYKNEKSLYPYLKTLVDINLIKTNNTGKKRTWKKSIIIIDKNNK